MDQAQHVRIVLASRPTGAPTASSFRVERGPVPTPGPGQMLVRTLYLSLDPYMRGRMSDAPSYAAPVEVGAVMVGGTVAVVEASHVDGFAAGDPVVAYTGWQSHVAVGRGRGAKARPRRPRGRRMPSASSDAGLHGVHGAPPTSAPRAPGETVVVSAATGAVGSVVGQVARLLGCRVVGVAVGPTSAATP